MKRDDKQKEDPPSTTSQPMNASPLMIQKKDIS